MAWQYIQYEYPVPYTFDKVLMWISVNCHCYFAMREKSTDDWIYFGAASTHALGTGYRLTRYTSEVNAQTNYFQTAKDSSGKVIAVLPLHFLARYVRLYIDIQERINIYEFRPSTLVLADEIMAGELRITDDFINPPLIRIIKSGTDRIKIGNFDEDTFGLAGYDDDGNAVFEISDLNRKIGGWNFDGNKLYSEGLELDSENQRIRSTNYVSGAFGSGFTLEPNLLEVGNIASRGIIRTSVFQKDTISAVGGNLLVTKGADVLSQDMATTDYALLEIEGNETFEVGDIIRIKEETADEWMVVANANLNSVCDETGAVWGPPVHGLSFFDGQAFAFISGVNQTSYSDGTRIFAIRDTNDRLAFGYTGLVGGGETLESSIVVDGSFDSYSGTMDDGTSCTFTYWNVTGTDDSVNDIIEATANADGTGTAVKFVNTSGTALLMIDQDINVEGGKLYKLNFRTRGDNTNSISYSVKDATNDDEDIIAFTSSGVTSTTYTTVTVYFTAPLDGSAVTIQFLSSALLPGVELPETEDGPSASVEDIVVRLVSVTYLDNVAVQEVTDCAATGLKIIDPYDGSAQNWIFVHDDFNCNDSAYTFDIYELDTGVTGNVYVVERDKAGSYSSGDNPAWPKGATVANYGQSGDGGILLTASETNAPYMSVFSHAGTPYITLTEMMRIGNLNGYAGYVVDAYGMAIYEDEYNYLKADVDGISLSSDKDGALTISGGGNIKLLSGGDIILETEETNPSKLSWYTSGVKEFSLTTVGSGVLAWGPKEADSGKLLLGSPYKFEVLEAMATEVLLYSEYTAGGSAGSEKAPTSTCTDPINDTNATTGWTAGNSASLASTLKTSTYYPPAHSSTYVKATSYFSLAYFPHYATDPNRPITGFGMFNEWASNGSTNQRFHIDLGTAKVVNQIYYENGRSMGLKDFTFWGSNTEGAFNELTYGTDTNWTQLTPSQSWFDPHDDSDIPDPKFIIVNNTTAYRYYAIKIANCWNPGFYSMHLRHVELQFVSSTEYSLQIKRNGVDYPQAYAVVDIHSVANYVYNLSFKVRADNCPKASYRAHVYFSGSLIYLPSSSVETVTGEWASHSYSIIIPSGASGATLYFQNYTTLDTEYVEIDDVTVTLQSGIPSGSVLVESGDGYGRVIIKTFGEENMRIAQGNVTKPLQPAFLAVPSATQENIAINSWVTVFFATEIFDQGSDFNTATYTFTAPVTGKYQLNVVVLLDNIDTAATYYIVRIVTSNRDYQSAIDPTKFSADVAYFPMNFSVLADMDANDTAYVTVYQSGGTSQADVHSTSYFSGALIC